LKNDLRPNEGKKTDPAHPAIYPTGIMPKLRDRQEKVYDLIVKRFLACFSSDAKRETVTIFIDVEKEQFISRGTRTLIHGWHKFYAPYLNLEEQEMPLVKNNDLFINKETIKHDKETQPPKRYTPASIIRELEKQNLGTKATRASIVESLFQRNYIKNESIEATELGIQTTETLEKYCPEILDENLTRHFENEMEKIRQKKMNEDQVLKEAQKTLNKILDKFKKNEKSIGKELGHSQKQSLDKENLLGKCPNCDKGNLKIMYSRKSKKRFIACDNYPACKTIKNMPGYGILKAIGKTCEHCKYPIVKIIAGRNTRETCINMHCPSKKVQDKAIQKHIDAIEQGHIIHNCPKCGKTLVLRRSMYGQFFGCSGFPSCRYVEQIPKNEEEQKNVDQKREYFKKQAEENKIKEQIGMEKTEIKEKMPDKSVLKEKAMSKSHIKKRSAIKKQLNKSKNKV